MRHRFVSPLKDCELFIKDDQFPGKFGSHFNTLFHLLPKHKKYGFYSVITIIEF